MSTKRTTKERRIAPVQESYEPRYERVSITAVKGGFIVYNAPYNSGEKPSVFATVDDLLLFINEWAYEVDTEE